MQCHRQPFSLTAALDILHGVQEHLEELQGRMAALSAEETQRPASPTVEQARLQDQIRTDNAAIDELRQAQAAVNSQIEQLEAE